MQLLEWSTISHSRTALYAEAMSSGSPEVLIITGPVGSGKTSVALEAAELLHEFGGHHAVIDLDALRWCWPQPEDDPFGTQLGYRNLRRIWPEYEAQGVRRLLIADVIESRDELSDFQTALPNATFTIVRLMVDEPLLRTRIRARETGSGLEWNLNRAGELSRIMDDHSVEDFRIENNGQPLVSVARTLLITANWISG